MADLFGSWVPQEWIGEVLESDKRLNFYWRNPAAMKAAMEGELLSTASFLALRAYFKIMNRYKQEDERRQGKRRGRPPKSA
jgi:hypothetical protein